MKLTLTNLVIKFRARRCCSSSSSAANSCLTQNCFYFLFNIICTLQIFCQGLGFLHQRRGRDWGCCWVENVSHISQKIVEEYSFAISLFHSTMFLLITTGNELDSFHHSFNLILTSTEAIYMIVSTQFLHTKTKNVKATRCR